MRRYLIGKLITYVATRSSRHPRLVPQHARLPVGFSGFVSKLWRVLALVSVPGSIHYIVLPGWHRDDLLAAA